jgi:hypothetical protein
VTPETGPQSNLDTILTTPVASSAISATNPTSQFTFTVKTPSTPGRPQLDHDEIHPSKAQQSTTKKPNSGLRLGFSSVTNSPRVNAGSIITNNPSKVGLPSNMASPGFKFTRPESQLSQEAQTLMEGLREEAARIKEQMALQREKQLRKDGEAEQLYSAVGRKMAKPKGRAGRFSDIHMAEFKKMDSIAGHASVYRTKPVPVESNPKSLKRSPSKAGLDELDKPPPPKKLHETMSETTCMSPAKRVRQQQTDDQSSSRPSTSDGTSPGKQYKSSLPRVQSGLPFAATTPTKASLARSASMKTLKTTNVIPLAWSPSTKTITAPSSASAAKYKSFLPTATNLKSILRRHQPLFSNDPVKIAAGTHIASPNLNKKLPDAPKSDLEEFNPPSSTKKRVGFTPSTKNRHSVMPGGFPSPSKEVEQASSAAIPQSSTPSVTYPTLPDLGSPSTFKFTGGSRIFEKMKSPTIRRVRPSNIRTMTNESVNTLTSLSPNPQGFLSAANPITSLADLPSIPHGMPNKKRRHESDNEDEENLPEAQQPEEPNVKRVKRAPAVEALKAAQNNPAQSRIPRRGAAGAKSKGKGMLSLSRLNMLARPKERK